MLAYKKDPRVATTTGGVAEEEFDMDNYKTCTKCQQTLKKIHFHTKNSAKDGLQAYCKTCTKSLRNKHYQNNRSKELLANAKYRITNRENIRNKQRLDAHNKPEKYRLNLLINRGRQLGAKQGLLTPKDIKRLLNKKCAYCDMPATEIDHVIPLARNGSNTIGNLVGSCQFCNRSKNNKLITEWKKVRGW